MSIHQGPASLDKARLTALVFVIAAHAAMIAFLPGIRASLRPAKSDESMVVFLRFDEPLATPPQTAAPASRRREPEELSRADTTSPKTGSPVTHAPSVEHEPRPDDVDWAMERELAAGRHAETLKEEDRWASAFSMPADRAGERAKAPEFGWRHSQIHRIEPLEGGGMVIWINDRCAIVFVLIPILTCKVGKIGTRGDLFEHLSDPPTPGDWKDP